MASTEHVRPATWRWIVVGGVSGAMGAFLFGVVLAVAAPEVIASDIPGFYGFDESAIVGWIAHLTHGIVLGVIFGFVVTRTIVFGALMTTAETDILARIGGRGRLTLAGVVYGIAIWAILPFLGVSLLGVIRVFEDPGFGGLAVEMFVGHVLFGLLVGALFAMLTPIEHTPTQRSRADTAEGTPPG